MEASDALSMDSNPVGERVELAQPLLPKHIDLSKSTAQNTVGEWVDKMTEKYPKHQFVDISYELQEKNGVLDLETYSLEGKKFYCVPVIWTITIKDNNGKLKKIQSDARENFRFYSRKPHKEGTTSAKDKINEQNQQEALALFHILGSTIRKGLLDPSDENQKTQKKTGFVVISILKRVNNDAGDHSSNFQIKSIQLGDQVYTSKDTVITVEKTIRTFKQFEKEYAKISSKFYGVEHKPGKEEEEELDEEIETIKRDDLDKTTDEISSKKSIDQEKQEKVNETKKIDEKLKELDPEGTNMLQILKNADEKNQEFFDDFDLTRIKIVQLMKQAIALKEFFKSKVEQESLKVIEKNIPWIENTLEKKAIGRIENFEIYLREKKVELGETHDKQKIRKEISEAIIDFYRFIQEEKPYFDQLNNQNITNKIQEVSDYLDTEYKVFLESKEWKEFPTLKEIEKGVRLKRDILPTGFNQIKKDFDDLIQKIRHESRDDIPVEQLGTSEYPVLLQKRKAQTEYIETLKTEYEKAKKIQEDFKNTIKEARKLKKDKEFLKDISSRQEHDNWVKSSKINLESAGRILNAARLDLETINSAIEQKEIEMEKKEPSSEGTIELP